MKFSQYIQSLVDVAIKRNYNCRQLYDLIASDVKRRQQTNGTFMEIDLDVALKIDGSKIHKALIPHDCIGCGVEKTCPKNR